MRECVADQCRSVNCNKIVMREWEATGALVPVCSVYLVPKSWWRRGTCPIAYKHIEAAGRFRIGQQKGKKRKKK